MGPYLEKDDPNYHRVRENILGMTDGEDVIFVGDYDVGLISALY